MQKPQQHRDKSNSAIYKKTKTLKLKGVYYRNEKLILAGRGGAHL